MSRLRAALAVTARELDERKVSWALIGGLAVSARIEPRFTRDVDLAVSLPDDAAVEALVFHLQGRGFRVQMLLDQTAAQRLATVRLIPPGEPPAGIVVDLLFASSGIEPEIARSAETLEVFDDLRVPVATRPHLIALKLLSRSPRRPQDDHDLVALLTDASPEDIEAVREALVLMDSRGFSRDKDLPGELEVLLRVRTRP